MSSVTPLCLLPFMLFLLLLTNFSIAQVYSNVTLGTSLTAGVNSSWKSPSGDFAFGFRPLENDLFLLAIWFDKIPDKTVVWSANGDKPSPRGSKVELTIAGNLVLRSPRGEELWKLPETVLRAGEVNYAAMLDTGNFILSRGGENSSDYAWETFNQPTDTILPTQIMEFNSVLYSRQSENNYSRGRFRLRLTETYNNRNFVLNPVAYNSRTENNYEAYYNLFWLLGSIPIDVDQFVFNKSGDIYLMRTNGSKLTLKDWDNITPAMDVYYRATLDYDGVFTQYSHPRPSNGTNQQRQRWSILRLIPKDICYSISGRLGSGACGYNSYCTLSREKRPSCECAPRYIPVDSNNKFGDCRPDFLLPGCQEEETRNVTDLFELVTLKNVDWPTSDYDELESYNEQDCRSSCMNDCLCAIALFREGTCWKKKLPLPNGRFGEEVNGNALIKVRKANISISTDPKHCDSTPSLSPKKDRSTLITILSLLLGSSVFINFLLLCAIFLVFLCMDKKLRKNNHKSTVLRSNLCSFTYKELEEATSGFTEELGSGSFGIVYKGVTEEMGVRNYVAVKKLDKVFREGEKEFKTEVNVIGQTHHKNLVRLLGFCEEGQNRLLVYEYMSNSSLADHLFGISKPDWNQRIQIAFGISRGLMYLHEECSTQIIHCDIKPQNILLDDSFAARIADFGLAKLLMSDQTRTTTGIRGTKGYVAPEWFRNTPVTVKVDVYSFGVMLLEIICCRKSVEMNLEEEEKAILTDWAYDCYKKGKLQDLVENDEDAMNDMRRLERLVMISIWCIQEEPSLRPSMKKITQMLEGVLAVSAPPCPYPFSAFISDFTETKVSEDEVDIQEYAY